MPIGYGAAQKITLPRAEHYPAKFVIDQVEDVVMLFHGRVLKHYELERIPADVLIFKNGGAEGARAHIAGD